MTNRLIAILFLAASAIGTACHSTRTGPYAPPAEAMRNPLKAQELNQQAADLMDANPQEAERLLCEALTHDLYFGPAHNNLGVVHLSQGRYYEAANEFEWARKLMPGHPDPRMNLALTLERVGRIDEALATYESALEVYPNHLPTVQALARLQVRYDRSDDRTLGYLEDIALRSEGEWTRWASNEIIRLCP